MWTDTIYMCAHFNATFLITVNKRNNNQAVVASDYDI